MADRKQFLGVRPIDPELAQLIERSKAIPVTEEMLREQRISFAFGNAMNTEAITKESVRLTSEHVKLRAAS